MTEVGPRNGRPDIRAALDAAADAAVILDRDHRIVYRNAAAVRLAPGLAVGARLWPTAHVTRPSALGILRAVRNRRRCEVEVELLETDGERRWLAVRVDPIGGSGGDFRGTVLLATDITERVRADERIKHLANHDTLTGLANRRVFEAEVATRLSGCTGDQTAIFMLDLDHFKAINDLLGHPVGDRLLIRIGAMLRDFVAEGDLVARLGGDEFALLISGDDIDRRAEQVAAEVVEKLGQSIDVGSRQLNTGVSVGVLIVAEGDCTADEAIRRVDLALYEAKRLGRGRFAFYDPAMTVALGKRSVIEAELRQGIASGGLHLEYQQQVAAANGRLAGFEALLRWRNARLGLVPPGDFIGIAEESGLILELTEMTLREGCTAAADWSRRGFRGRVALNISPVLFREDVTALIRDALDQSGCPPEAIEIEITETVLLSDSETNRRKTRAIRALGVEIAIDDFGIGFSSLGYLRQFPVDRIKIDRTFVSELGRSPQAAAIVTAITELGHAHGMQVTAEGVERHDQVAVLIEAGCDRMQGFYFGASEPRAAATERVLDALFEAAMASGVAGEPSRKRSSE